MDQVTTDRALRGLLSSVFVFLQWSIGAPRFSRICTRALILLLLGVQLKHQQQHIQRTLYDYKNYSYGYDYYYHDDYYYDSYCYCGCYYYYYCDVGGDDNYYHYHNYGD